MPAPARITEWIRQAYPKPIVDPNWLDACLAWIAEELHFSDFDTQGDEIISNVDSQLLNSDLHDSMLAGTGFPLDIGSAEDTQLRGHILVQIQGVTEIGHSAFSLKNVQQARIDRADLAGLTADNEDGDDEGPIPKYPRSMLQFELSDGSQSVRAIEHRRLPELELGITPLGYKMILKDVHVRQGIAFLEPSSVELKGYMTEELEVNRDADFARNLRMRLGQPEPEPDSEPDEAPANNNFPGDLPPPEAPDGAAVQVARSPLREMKMDDPFLHRPPPRLHLHEHEPPTRRRVPSSDSTLASTSTTTVVSPYFSNTTTSAAPAPSSDLTTIRLSSLRRTPLPTSVGEDSFDFSDDIPMDDAFFQELDAVEQAAINTIHDHSRNIEHPSIGLSGPGAATSTESEVIVIDSDSEDKENLAPVVERRVRRRLATPGDDDSDVIVIE